MLTKQAYAQAQARGEMMTLARYGLLSKVSYDTREKAAALKDYLLASMLYAAGTNPEVQAAKNMRQAPVTVSQAPSAKTRERPPELAPAPAPAKTQTRYSVPHEQVAVRRANAPSPRAPATAPPAAAPPAPPPPPPPLPPAAEAAHNAPAAAAPSHRNKILAGLAGLAGLGAAGGVIHHRRQQAKQRQNALLALAAGGALGLGGAAFAAHRQRQREMEE